MPALPAEIGNYIQSVKDSLASRPDGSTDVDLAPLGAGYVRAMDVANVLQLLQEALSQSSALTATGGTTSTVVDGAATFVANSQVGNTVTFSGNTTAALAGVSAVVVANSATTLTFGSVLPAAPAAGDEYTIEGTMLDTEIAELRGDSALGLADSPRGSAYGETRTVHAACQKLSERLAASSLAERQVSRPGAQTGSGSTESVVVTEDTDLKIDQFKGMTLTISGESRRIVSNSETSFTLASDLSSAPAAATAYTVTVPNPGAAKNQFPGELNAIHPAGHPSTAQLAEMLEAAEAAVVAFTLPT